MNTPGFTAESTLHPLTQYTQERFSEARQGLAEVIPAYYLYYPCASSADGGVIYCRGPWIPGYYQV